VNANLVCAAGFEITAQECMPAPSLDHLVTRSREAAAGDHRHSQPVFWMPPDRALQLARVRFEAPERDRQVRAAQRPVAELR